MSRDVEQHLGEVRGRNNRLFEENLALRKQLELYRRNDRLLEENLVLRKQLELYRKNAGLRAASVITTLLAFLEDEGRTTVITEKVLRALDGVLKVMPMPPNAKNPSTNIQDTNVTPNGMNDTTTAVRDDNMSQAGSTPNLGGSAVRETPVGCNLPIMLRGQATFPPTAARGISAEKEKATSEAILKPKPENQKPNEQKQEGSNRAEPGIQENESNDALNTDGSTDSESSTDKSNSSSLKQESLMYYPTDHTFNPFRGMTVGAEPRSPVAAASPTTTPNQESDLQDSQGHNYAPQTATVASPPKTPNQSRVGHPMATSTPMPSQSEFQAGIHEAQRAPASPTSNGYSTNRHVVNIEYKALEQFLKLTGPNKRLLGEIAFQLDRRILTYVFGMNDDQHNNMKRRFYGYIVQNIPEMIKRDAVNVHTGQFDPQRAAQIKYRYDYVLHSLRPLGYDVNVHPAVTLDMVNRYGLLPVPVNQAMAGLFSLHNKKFIEDYLINIASKHEMHHLLILLNSLALLAHDDGRALFLW